jgi:membrane protein
MMQVWWELLSHTWQRISRDNLSALAAAAAFYALLSIFPALTAMVSLYGLITDPSMVGRQVTAMQGVLPPEAAALIATWLQAFVKGPPSRFDIGLIVSVLLAFWSAWSATGMLMTAVNTCYGEQENRNFVWFNLRAVALTAGLALFGVAALALLAVLPAALNLLPLPEAWTDAIALVRWPILAGIVLITLAIVYHYAPDRDQPKWQWISWGAVAATALWLSGSAEVDPMAGTTGLVS